MMLCKAVRCTSGQLYKCKTIYTHTLLQVAPQIVQTRGYAKVKEDKGEPKKEKKENKATEEVPVEEKKGRITTREEPTVNEIYSRFYNQPPQENENAEEDGSSTPTVPSVTRDKLLEMLNNNEKFVLVDLRTHKEILLSGDGPIPNAVSMPIPPFTHLDSYKPPKVKGPKGAKSKGGKDAKKSAKGGKQVNQPPPKEEAVQKDYFRISYRMTPSTWQDTYKFPKIGFQDNVIFYSSSRVRSSAIVASAKRIGYKNVKILEGGSRLWNKYNDFAQHEQEIKNH